MILSSIIAAYYVSQMLIIIKKYVINMLMSW